MHMKSFLNNKWKYFTLIVISIFVSSCSENNITAKPDYLTAILKTAEKHREELINLRRDFHMHPELSGEEIRTAGIVARRLRALGLEVRTGVGGHGVVGILRGAKAGPVVAYRADMDAFPSDIVGNQSYRSRVPGVKHICGHDVHTTVALGVATVLSSMSHDLPGTVIFIFQPAEERDDGALAMLADGVLLDPVPDAIFALHTAPIPVGTIMLNSGSGLSGFRDFEISWKPSTDNAVRVDRVIKALSAINTVQSEKEVFTSPELINQLISDIMIPEGSLTRFKNVRLSQIEGQKLIKIRTKAPTMKQLDEVENDIMEIIEVFNKDGANYTVKLTHNLITMRQNQKLIQQSRKQIEDVVGVDGILTSYGAFPYNGEDFAYFLKEVPGTMFFLGVTNEKRGIRGVNHLPDYDVDEDSILIGTKAMSNVLLNYLKVN